MNAALQNAIVKAELARNTARRRHADRLSHTITDLDLKGWFMATHPNGNIPTDPCERIELLLPIRDYFASSHNNLVFQKVEAAICRELKREEELNSAREAA